MIMEIEKLINPGHFPKGVTPSKPKHQPVNRTLSQYMYDIGFIEKYGTGIVNVRRLLKANGNKDLKYELHKIETKAIIYSQVYEKREVIEKTREETVEKTVEKILELIRQNPKIIQGELSEKTGLSRRGVEWNIEQLKKLGKLKRVGPDKGGYWEILEK